MTDDDKVVYLNYAGFQCLEGLQHSSIDLYLSTCGIQNCYSGHSFGPGKRDYYILHFISDGKGSFTCHGKTHELEKGDVFLVKPDTEVSYKADEKNPWSYMWVGFQGVKAAAYLAAAGLEGDSVTCKCENTPLIFSYIQNMIIFRHLSQANELRRQASLLNVLSTLIEEYKTSLPKQEQYDYPYQVYVEQAIDYMQRNIRSNVRVNDIASYIGIDRSYLTKVFKNEMGISPQEYLVRYRMEQAEQLLLQPDKKILEIAETVGYTDAMTFSKAFKKYKGVTPSEYRNQQFHEE